MAKIFLSEVLQNIAGSIGEHTFGCWKGVNYLRQKAVTISNPCSLVQSSVRAALTAISKMWYADLTASQRALWNEYAQGLKSAGEQVGPNGNGGAGIFQVIPGNGGVMSGFNSFVMVNVLAIRAGFPAISPPVPDAPIGIDAPDAPTVLTLDDYCFSAGDPSLGCGFLISWTDPVVAPVGSIIRVWTVSLDAGVHKQIVGLVALSTESFWFHHVKAALGASSRIDSLIGHYHIQIDCISPSGLKSPPSNVITEEALSTCAQCAP